MHKPSQQNDRVSQPEVAAVLPSPPTVGLGARVFIGLLSVAMGLLLAFTRRNPFLNRSPYIVRWSKP